VIEPSRVPSPLYPHYSPGRVSSAAERTAQAREIEAKLAALAAAAAAARGVQATAEVREQTDVAEAICRTAEQLDVDAVCLSSCGRGGISRALVGSVAERVLAAARPPVLLVRPGIA
jgi:nucleotide-binding universal stress UspA family protein